MEIAGTIQLSTSFYTNEYAETPDRTYLTFSQAEIDRVQHLIDIAAKEDVTISMDFDADDFKQLGDTDEELKDSDFRVGYECLKIYPNGTIYYYAQNSYDSAIQFESESFTLNDIIRNEKQS